MIQAETIKAIQEVLQSRGIEHRECESWGDYVARGLGISDATAEVFLEALHDGLSVEEARRAAGISDGDRAKRLARTLGKAIGRIKLRIAPSRECLSAARKRTGSMGEGATEDQMNTTLQVPERIDDYGTKVEDMAGTGVHDSQGG